MSGSGRTIANTTLIALGLIALLCVVPRPMSAAGLNDLTSAVEETLEPLTEPVAEPATEPVVEETRQPLTEPVAQVVEPVTELVAAVAEPAAQVIEPLVEEPRQAFTETVVEPVTEEPLQQIVEPVVEPVAQAAEPVAEPVAQVIEPIAQSEPDGAELVTESAEANFLASSDALSPITESAPDVPLRIEDTAPERVSEVIGGATIIVPEADILHDTAQVGAALADISFFDDLDTLDIDALVGATLRESDLIPNDMAAVLDEIDAFGDNEVLTEAEVLLADSLEPVLEPATQLLDPVAPILDSVLEPLTPVLEPLTPVLEPVAPILEPVTPILDPVTPVLEPVLEPAAPLLVPVLEPVTPLLEPVLEPVMPLLEPVIPILEPVAPLLEPVLEPVAPILEPVTPLLKPVAPVLEPLTPVLEPVTPIFEPLTPVLEPVLESVLEPVTPIVDMWALESPRLLVSPRLIVVPAATLGVASPTDKPTAVTTGAPSTSVDAHLLNGPSALAMSGLNGLANAGLTNAIGPPPMPVGKTIAPIGVPAPSTPVPSQMGSSGPTAALSPLSYALSAGERELSELHLHLPSSIYQSVPVPPG